MTYPLTFYTNRFLPSWAAGATIGPFIFIRPHKKNDEGLYQHELTHVKQGFKGLFVFHSLLYLLVPKYRLACEVEAYKVQLKYYKDDRTSLFAKFIAEKYKLKVSREEVEKMLRKP